MKHAIALCIWMLALSISSADIFIDSPLALKRFGVELIPIDDSEEKLLSNYATRFEVRVSDTRKCPVGTVFGIHVKSPDSELSGDYIAQFDCSVALESEGFRGETFTGFRFRVADPFLATTFITFPTKDGGCVQIEMVKFLKNWKKLRLYTPKDS
jgi:hypothetical protein